VDNQPNPFLKVSLHSKASAGRVPSAMQFALVESQSSSPPTAQRACKVPLRAESGRDLSACRVPLANRYNWARRRLQSPVGVCDSRSRIVRLPRLLSGLGPHVALRRAIDALTHWSWLSHCEQTFSTAIGPRDGLCLGCPGQWWLSPEPCNPMFHECRRRIPLFTVWRLLTLPTGCTASSVCRAQSPRRRDRAVWRTRGNNRGP
jgi:hypothetical protein